MIDLPKANYIEWNVKSVIKLNERDTYAYRVVLNYQDGTNTIQQKSGFKTKKEAEAVRVHPLRRSLLKSLWTKKATTYGVVAGKR